MIIYFIMIFWLTSFRKVSLFHYPLNPLKSLKKCYVIKKKELSISFCRGFLSHSSSPHPSFYDVIEELSSSSNYATGWGLTCCYWILHQILMLSNKVKHAAGYNHDSPFHLLNPIPSPPKGWTNWTIYEYYISKLN